VLFIGVLMELAWPRPLLPVVPARVLGVSIFVLRGLLAAAARASGVHGG
jgi:hypothetical protein